jgi:hypothetical protein
MDYFIIFIIIFTIILILFFNDCISLPVLLSFPLLGAIHIFNKNTLKCRYRLPNTNVYSSRKITNFDNYIVKKGSNSNNEIKKEIYEMSKDEIETKIQELIKENSNILKLLDKTDDISAITDINMILSYFKNKAHKPIYTYKILNILSEDINNTFSKSQAVKKQIQSKPGLVNDTTFWNSNIYNKEKKTFKDVLFINSNIFINEKLLDDFINTQLKNLGLNKGNLVGIDTYKTKLKSIQTYISDFKSKVSNDKNIESSSKEIVCNKTFNELETDININLQSFKDSRANHDMLTSGINTNNYCLYKLLLENKESITELKNAVECSDCFIKVKEKLLTSFYEKHG